MQTELTLKLSRQVLLFIGDGRMKFHEGLIWANARASPDLPYKNKIQELWNVFGLKKPTSRRAYFGCDHEIDAVKSILILLSVELDRINTIGFESKRLCALSCDNTQLCVIIRYFRAYFRCEAARYYGAEWNWSGQCRELLGASERRFVM